MAPRHGPQQGRCPRLNRAGTRVAPGRPCTRPAPSRIIRGPL
ncbi:hypothetical protein SZ55_5024 [Pseudomonas sp. FeS53a]|nr:hypothetical protein SZ55_5024 [Pseudomonas sp. FeS53a]